MLGTEVAKMNQIDWSDLAAAAAAGVRDCAGHWGCKNEPDMVLCLWTTQTEN